MSIAYVELQLLAMRYVIGDMQTVAETRLQRLALLVKRHGGSLAQLNVALGLDRTDATLSQIRTQAPHSKTGKPRSMGDPLARKIEEKLSLERGWMDTPPTHAEIHGEPDQREMMMQLMNSLPPEELARAMRMLAALKEPAQPLKNGTEH